MNSLIFNTVNESKKKEIKIIFNEKDFNIGFFSFPILEILSEDLEQVILNKALAAYKKCMVPVVVEHGALKIESLKGLPGALSKPIWDILGKDICNLIYPRENRNAIACSAVCYCDGKTRKHFISCTKGSISETSRGTNGFQWDPIFIPDGAKKTYAEMELEEKLSFSQATKAYSSLKNYLKSIWDI